MATKKKTTKKKKSPTTTTRRKKSLSAAKKSIGKRKKSKPRKKGGLSEIASATAWQETGKATLSGAIGGSIAYGVDRLVPEKWGTGARFLCFAAACAITGTVFGKPNVAAGIAGGGAVIVLDSVLNSTLGENADYADINALSEMPMFLSEHGEPMEMDADGNLHMLSEADLNLAERISLNEMRQQIYPGYYNQY